MENSELLKNIDDKISARQAELEQIINEHAAFQRGVDQQLVKFQQQASHTEGMIMELKRFRDEIDPPMKEVEAAPETPTVAAAPEKQLEVVEEAAA